MSISIDKKTPFNSKKQIKILKTPLRIFLIRYLYKLKNSSFKKVITGCDKTTQLRRIAFKPNMPEIVHNGDTDCIYAIDAKEEPRSMFKLDVKSFPSLHHACHAHVQIANTNSVKDLVGNPQAFFDTLDTVKSFDSSVIVSERIVLIKTTNCYANSEPINIAVNRVVSKSIFIAYYYTVWKNTLFSI